MKKIYVLTDHEDDGSVSAVILSSASAEEIQEAISEAKQVPDYDQESVSDYLYEKFPDIEINWVSDSDVDFLDW